MGDMADWVIDSWFDDGAYDYGSSFIRCKYCGEDFLHWENIDGKWRLCTEKYVVHTCKHINDYHHSL